MPFALRSFDAVLDDLRASNPRKKLKPHDNVHYTATAAWSVHDLSKWPSNPPLTAVLKVRDPHDHDEKLFTSAAALVSYANFGNTIGTWNARGDGTWAGDGESWIIADVNLTQEQAGDEEGSGDYVDLIIALWRLSDGWAAAVLRDSERALAAKLVGLDGWPETGWQTEPVWFGE